MQTFQLFVVCIRHLYLRSCFTPADFYVQILKHEKRISPGDVSQFCHPGCRLACSSRFLDQQGKLRIMQREKSLSHMLVSTRTDPDTKRFKRTLIYFNTDGQDANFDYSLSLIYQPDIRGHEAPHHHHLQIFGGNPLYQATKRHLLTTDKRLKTMKNERKRLTLFWLSFCSLFGQKSLFVSSVQTLKRTRSNRQE